MTEETQPKPRVVLGKLALDLASNAAGDAKPTAEHLDAGITGLMEKISKAGLDRDAAERNTTSHLVELVTERQDHDKNKFELAEALKELEALRTARPSMSADLMTALHDIRAC